MRACPGDLRDVVACMDTSEAVGFPVVTVEFLLVRNGLCIGVEALGRRVAS
jgi:hypothetical protein